jgi:hypothetical protein
MYRYFNLLDGNRKIVSSLNAVKLTASRFLSFYPHIFIFIFSLSFCSSSFFLCLFYLFILLHTVDFHVKMRDGLFFVFFLPPMLYRCRLYTIVLPIYINCHAYESKRKMLRF